MPETFCNSRFHFNRHNWYRETLQSFCYRTTDQLLVPPFKRDLHAILRKLKIASRLYQLATSQDHIYYGLKSFILKIFNTKFHVFHDIFHYINLISLSDSRKNIEYISWLLPDLIWIHWSDGSFEKRNAWRYPPKLNKTLNSQLKIVKL